MKNIKIIIAALGLIALGACNAIEDATTIKVDVPNFELNIPAAMGIPTSAAPSATAFNFFSGSYTLSINDPAFNELRRYKKLISDVKITDVSVTISNASGTHAQNLLLKAEGVGQFTLANYTFGTPYTGSEELKTFLKNIIFALKNDTVIVKASGETDATSGAIDIVIAVEGVQVWAKTL